MPGGWQGCHQAPQEWLLLPEHTLGSQVAGLVQLLEGGDLFRRPYVMEAEIHTTSRLGPPLGHERLQSLCQC